MDPPAFYILPIGQNVLFGGTDTQKRVHAHDGEHPMCSSDIHLLKPNLSYGSKYVRLPRGFDARELVEAVKYLVKEETAMRSTLFAVAAIAAAVFGSTYSADAMTLPASAGVHKATAALDLAQPVVWRGGGWRGGYRGVGWRGAGWRRAAWRGYGGRHYGWRRAAWRGYGWRRYGWRRAAWRLAYRRAYYGAGYGYGGYGYGGCGCY
jgi:hypothetical protein